jgi:hypothetical protein
VPLGRCGRGLIIVGTDYQSTNVSLVGLDGAVLSSSFISSGSTSSALSAALSGDVVTSTTPQLGEEVVLIDRYPASVVTWLDVATGEVRAQLEVRTGFPSNPQDYLALSDDEAYVSRYETNPTPGQVEHDGGGDVLIIDPSVPSITGRIDLQPAVTEPGFLPRAGRMVRDGDSVYVLLAAYDQTFASSAPSRIVTLRDGAIAGVTVLDGLHGCSSLAIEPLSTSPRLAVACSGNFGGDESATLAESGVVILATFEDDIPVEIRRHAASAQPFGFGLDFIDDRRVLATALGSFGNGGPDVTDALLVVDIDSGDVTTVLRGKELPFELGDVRCTTAVALEGSTAGCSSCWLADGEAGRLHRISVDADGAIVAESIQVDSSIGLPPRGVGRF